MNGNSIIPTDAEHDAHYCDQSECENCGEKFTQKHFEDDFNICPECREES